MPVKFLGFRRDPSRLDFHDVKRWQPVDDGRSYKLVKPDLEKDRMFSTAEIKAVKAIAENERLYISGIANANIIDRVQERLDPRGIEVQDYLKNPQLLAHHSYYHPVGQVEQLDIQEDGIHFRGWVGDPAKGPLTVMQSEMRSLVAQGIMRTVSVGFIPKKVRAPLFDDNGTMTEPCVIEAWELLEISLVAVPCNQDSVFEMRNYSSEDGSGKVKETLENLPNPDTVKQNETNAEGDMSAKVKEAATDNAGDQYQQESLTMLRAMGEMLTRNTELTELCLKKLEAKPNGENENEETPPPPKEEEAAKALRGRVDGIEKTLSKLVQSFDALVKKIV